MFSQLFGRYLVDKALLREEDYKIIIDKQLSVRVKLGTIAISEGLLTEEQVDLINELQKQRDKRFGDIAIEEKMLTDDQISSLLAKQGNPYLQFLQLLTESTPLTNSQIEEQLQAFQQARGFSDSDMDALKKDDIDSLIPIFIFSAKPHVTEVAGLVIRNLNRFISRDFYIGRATRAKELPYQYLATQRMVGDDSISIAFVEEQESGGLLQIASEFSRENLLDVSDDTFDAVCEFINVTCGLYASDMSVKDIHLDMEPPAAYKDQVAEGDFYILPIYIENKSLSLVISVNTEFDPGKIPVKIASTSSISRMGGGDKGTILLVDDSKMSRNMLASIVTKAGYTIIGEASNGIEGYETYLKIRPDIITLDITMPEMDGLESLKRILDADPDAKAIMITAAGQQDKLIEALKVGAKRFISKPFQEEEIINNINDVMSL